MRERRCVPFLEKKTRSPETEGRKKKKRYPLHKNSAAPCRAALAVCVRLTVKAGRRAGAPHAEGG